MPEQEMTLSQAASILRNEKATPEERSRAASILGKRGGSKKTTEVKENEDE